MRLAAIVTHYQGTQTDEQLQTCVNDIATQIGSGSIHVLHDGPLHRPWPEGVACCYLHVTPSRMNQWGHNLRRLGLLYCDEEYVWFTNADNRLYAHAFETIRRNLLEDGAIFAIKDFHDKLQPTQFRELPASADHGRDCMQAIFKRDIWMQHNAWVERRADADGHLIRAILGSRNVSLIDDCLGEHH